MTGLLEREIVIGPLPKVALMPPDQDARAGKSLILRLFSMTKSSNSPYFANSSLVRMRHRKKAIDIVSRRSARCRQESRRTGGFSLGPQASARQCLDC